MGSAEGLSLHQVRLRAWPVDKDMAHGLGGAMGQLGSSGFRVGLASVTRISCRGGVVRQQLCGSFQPEAVVP